MAPVSRGERLFDILQAESKKMGRMAPRAPAVFRETALDTHPTAPTEGFNTAWQNAGITAAKYGSATMAANNVNTLRKQLVEKRTNSKQPTPEPQTEFKSVFKPRPGQEHVCGLATEHRARVANSEWALLDTLEVAMHVKSREEKAAKERARQEATRRNLDDQMQERLAATSHEAATTALEKRLLDEEVERYNRDQAAKAQAERARNMAMRKEREEMLAAANEAKARAAAAKKAEEAADLEEALRQVEAAKAAAQAKVAAAKATMEKTRAENDARIAARKAAEAAQRAADEALMRETIATLERQEREREEKLKAFMASIAARADRAGLQVVAENKERAEREARMIKQYEAQKEAEHQAREAAAAAKRAKEKAELAQARDEQLRAKAAKRAAEVEALRQEREATEAQVARDAAAHEAKVAGMRARSKATQDFLLGQMTAKERVAVEDDVGMTQRERELNGRLLNQATLIVKEPKQMSVRLY